MGKVRGLIDWTTLEGIDDAEEAAAINPCLSHEQRQEFYKQLDELRLQFRPKKARFATRSG